MPRKSAAELSTRPVDVTGRTRSRLVPDRALSPDAARIFRAAVAAAPPGFFTEMDRVGLTQLAEAAARCQRAERALSAEGEVLSGKPNPWLLVLRDARHQVTNLLPKLRLCPSARIQPKQVKPDAAGPVAVDFSTLARPRR